MSLVKDYKQVRKSIFQSELVLKAEEGDTKTVFGNPMEYHSGKWEPAEGGSQEEDSDIESNLPEDSDEMDTGALEDQKASEQTSTVDDWHSVFGNELTPSEADNEQIEAYLDDRGIDMSPEEFSDAYDKQMDEIDTAPDEFEDEGREDEEPDPITDADLNSFIESNIDVMRQHAINALVENADVDKKTARALAKDANYVEDFEAILGEDELIELYLNKQDDSEESGGEYSKENLNDDAQQTIADNVGDWMLTMRSDFEEDNGSDQEDGNLSDDDFYNKYESEINEDILLNFAEDDDEDDSSEEFDRQDGTDDIYGQFADDLNEDGRDALSEYIGDLEDDEIQTMLSSGDYSELDHITNNSDYNEEYENEVEESAGCPDTPKGQRTGKRDGTQGVGKSFNSIKSSLNSVKKTLRGK